MLRLIRFLPFLIPVARQVLRNKKVRETLRLKPLPEERRRGRRR
ncbi:hypothetical protein [Herbiconiux sp. L3-i23]|nr:hypothetical protein [Herbiconiux sp. L3-i23]BDI22241.1 hypothetical protein L3i23_10170 [Herbiconiux sp. L3-i23]